MADDNKVENAELNTEESQISSATATVHNKNEQYTVSAKIEVKEESPENPATFVEDITEEVKNKNYTQSHKTRAEIRKSSDSYYEQKKKLNEKIGHNTIERNSQEHTFSDSVLGGIESSGNERSEVISLKKNGELNVQQFHEKFYSPRYVSQRDQKITKEELIDLSAEIYNNQKKASLHQFSKSEEVSFSASSDGHYTSETKSTTYHTYTDKEGNAFGIKYDKKNGTSEEMTSEQARKIMKRDQKRASKLIKNITQNKYASLNDYLENMPKQTEQSKYVPYGFYEVMEGFVSSDDKDLKKAQNEMETRNQQRFEKLKTGPTAKEIVARKIDQYKSR